MENILSQLDKNEPERLNDEDNTSEDYLNQLHVFFMSEDRDKNVLGTKILSDIFKHKDYKYSKNISKIIYCNTRQDNVTGIVEDSCSSITDKLEVKIIDDAHLSIDLLKKDLKSHPINFVEIDKTNNYLRFAATNEDKIENVPL